MDGLNTMSGTEEGGRLLQREEAPNRTSSVELPVKG
jgi:hypothetical protein